MLVKNLEDVEAVKVQKVQYQGKPYEVKGTFVRWMIHSGMGGPEYKHNFAIRYFTIEPGGEVPMHSHDYVQAGFIISGKVMVSTDKEKREVGPGDFIYLASYEPHEFKNVSQTEEAKFTCTIDCPRGEAGCSSPVLPDKANK